MTSAVICCVERQIVICADRTSSPQTARKFLVFTDCDGWCVGGSKHIFVVDVNTGRFFGRTGSLSAYSASMCCPSSIARSYQKYFTRGDSYRDRQDRMGLTGTDLS